MFTMGVVD
jgi:peptide chain release factor subunit 3